MKAGYLFLTLALTSTGCFAGQQEVNAIEAASRINASAQLATIAAKAQGYDNALANYRLAASYSIVGLNRQANKALDHAIDVLTSPEIDRDLGAEASILLAHCYGLKIKTQTAQSARYITLGTQAREEARAVSPDNPRLALIDGISLFYTPKQYGGGKDKAVIAFDSALAAFANDSQSPVQWGEAETLVWRGLAEEALAQKEKARASWQKALELHEDFAWAKMLLQTLEASND